MKKEMFHSSHAEVIPSTKIVISVSSAFELREW